MIKVTYIITCLDTGGAEMMLYKLLNGMDQTQFSPVVITLMDGGTLRQRFVDMGIDVYSLGMKRGTPSFMSILKLKRLMKDLAPDVIQGWMYHGNLVASLGSIFSQKKTVCFWNILQSVYSLRSEKKLTAWLIRLGGALSFLPRRIIYISKVGCEQHERLGYCKHKSLVIPNGFDTHIFKPDALAKAGLCDELSLPHDVVLLGMIGRFHPMKDHYNFLSAAKKVLGEHPDIHFFMAGRDVCEDNVDLMRWVDELDLMGELSLLGERLDIPTLTAAMDIAVLSSSSEAFPTVVGEAMACATPCVVTDVGDATYIMGETGLVVPASNFEALAEAMIEMIEMPASKRAEMGKMARERVTELFSIGSVVKKYEKLYLKGC